MRFLIILFVFLFQAFIAKPQQQLSLDEAIKIGLERNFAIRIERQNVEIANNNNDWGQAGRYPTVTLDAAQNNTTTNIDNPASFLSGDITNRTIVPSVNLNWIIFQGFRANITKDRLERLQQQSQGNASIVIANTIQAIMTAYYQAQLEKRRMEEFENQLKLSKDRYDYLQTKYELGSAVTSDLLLEEGNYLTDSIQYVNQQLLYRNILRNFNLLLSEEPFKAYDFIDEMEAEIENYTYAELENKMFKDNINLKTQYITQSVFKDETRLAKTDRYPSVSLNSFYSYNRDRQDLSGASLAGGGSFDEPITNAITKRYGANFTISFTLFNGGRINRAIQNAIKNENIANLQVDQLKRSLTIDMANALDEYNIRKQLLGIADRQYEVAKTNLEISQDKFKNGSINSFDFRTVQNNSLTAATQRLQSVYNLIDAKVTLMRLTGGLLRAYDQDAE